MPKTEKCHLQRDTVNLVESTYGLEFCVKARQKNIYFSLKNYKKIWSEIFKLITF